MIRIVTAKRLDGLEAAQQDLAAARARIAALQEALDRESCARWDAAGDAERLGEELIVRDAALRAARERAAEAEQALAVEARLGRELLDALFVQAQRALEDR